MSTRSWADLVKDAGDVSTFSPIPDGIYDFKVIEAVVKTTGKGKTMFTVKAEVQTGPHAKRLVWDNLTVSPESTSAMGFFFRKMAAMGLTAENFFSREPSDDQVAAALVGRYFRGKVGHSEYNGNPRNDIVGYSPVTAGSSIPVVTPQAAPVAPQVAPVAPPVAPPVQAVAPVAPPVVAPPVAPPVAAAPAVQSPWDATATGPAVLAPNLIPAPQPPLFS